MSADTEDRLTKAVGDRYQEFVKSATRQFELQQALKRRQERLRVLEKEPEWFNYLAAFTAAVVSTLVMHPIDTIKTRLIASAVKQSPQGPATPAVDASGVKPFQLADVLDLYKGVVGNIVKEGPSSALYLGVYEAAKSRLLGTPLGAYPLAVYLVSGAVGEFFGSVVRAPAEAIKTSVQSGRAASTLDSVQRVVGTEDGRARVFAAWSASLWRDIPFGAVQLAVFEGLKSFIPGRVARHPAGRGQPAGGGAAGRHRRVRGRLDKRARRRGDDADHPADLAEGAEPLAFGEMAGRVWEQEGPQGFAEGWKDRGRVLYWGPAVSIFLTTYCVVRQAAAPLF
ncbi:unnamed protein product [Prorocentrum cordatum]|uniref:Uncharacterized protein n=1 Tax=Prorocentrum cordatum TaxID=2364126 RepID=A0ABN9VQX0_9DINO|nr:unnamed protein product [Polarella glacialis]